MPRWREGLKLNESYKKAIELYKKRVQSDPKDATPSLTWERGHSLLHQNEEAARDYRQATRLKPDDEEAFYQLECRNAGSLTIRKQWLP